MPQRGSLTARFEAREPTGVTLQRENNLGRPAVQQEKAKKLGDAQHQGGEKHKKLEKARVVYRALLH